MSRQPYIYTLPEAFIADKSVPMRWKLYALINGFWVSNLTAYASNAFFAEKLGCSTRHIQGCLEDLEKSGVLLRVETDSGRILVPGGTNPAFVGGRTVGSERDEPSVHPISDSISESIKGVSLRSTDILEVVEVSENDSPSREKKDPEGRKRALYWHARCKAEFGIEPSGGVSKTIRVLNEALKHLTPSMVKEMIDDWFDTERLEPHDMIQITRCLSPYRIDKFKAGLL